jgi:cytochrome oxidase Cu insertion factor (SCO1/SenC/PrrC family)
MTRSVVLSLLLLVGLSGILVVMVVRRFMQPAGVVLKVEEDGADEGSAQAFEAWQIEDFALTDTNGLEFDSAELRGRVWVTSFFFSSCPSICRQQNEIVRRLCRRYRDDEVRFVSISCDPETDTPERLKEYARVFEADPEDWIFLTGPMETITGIGEQSFRLGVGKRTHADRFVTVDKWGWVRGSYDWHDPRQMEALHQQLGALVEEQESPYAVPQSNLDQLDNEEWIREFALTDSEDQTFESESMKGQVWVASFFFSTCPTICRKQNDLIRRIYRQFGRQDVHFVSITCDPETDTPERLQDYARLYEADPTKWHFLTGDLTYIRRIAAERFQVMVDRRSHADRLIVVDRKGEVRGKFNWHEASEVDRTKELLEELLQEPHPTEKAAPIPENQEA